MYFLRTSTPCGVIFLYIFFGRVRCGITEGEESIRRWKMMITTGTRFLGTAPVCLGYYENDAFVK